MPLDSVKGFGLSLRNVYETAAVCLPTALEARQGGLTRAACDRRIAVWARRVIRNAGVQVHVAGWTDVDGARSFVVMSNHASLYDVPILFEVLGTNVRMVAKVELFGIPIFGPALEAAGMVPIDRANRGSAIRSLNHHAFEALRAGTSVWISPEGTRSPHGGLLPFKKGGFMLALEAGCPILPISLRGTGVILPARGVRSKTGVPVMVTVHPPIDPTAYTGTETQRRDALMADVRARIAEGL